LRGSADEVERLLSALANLDEVLLGITHVATSLPAAIVSGSQERARPLSPIAVAGPDVGHSQIR
jgi:hypothetical protein